MHYPMPRNCRQSMPLSCHILSYPFISYHILSITASRLPGLPNVEILVLHCSWKCCVALACWRLWVVSCVTTFYHSFCVAMWVFHSAVPYCISALILTKSKSICFQLQYIHVRNCRNFRVTTLLNWARPLQPGCSLESAGFDPEELHRRLHGETWLQCVFDLFTTKCGSEPLSICEHCMSLLTLLSLLRSWLVEVCSDSRCLWHLVTACIFCAKESCFSPSELQTRAAWGTEDLAGKKRIWERSLARSGKFLVEGW